MLWLIIFLLCILFRDVTTTTDDFFLSKRMVINKSITLHCVFIKQFIKQRKGFLWILNFGWLVASITAPAYLFFNKIPLHERSLLFFTSHNQPSSLALSEGDTPDRLLFQATHPEEHVQTELWSLFSFVLNHPKNKFNYEF